jgi:hypothetical protein
MVNHYYVYAVDRDFGPFFLFEEQAATVAMGSPPSHR